jgi:predicted type IV restriction endonuclease
MPPKYLDDAKARVQSQLKKFIQIVNQAKQRNLNEADTRDIVKAMISELLGFDPFFEVTGEFSIKGQFADFAVKTGEQIKFFVEVKSVDTKLDEKHLFQVIGYAANHGVEWAVLTNADRWVVYRLFSGDDKRTETILDFTLTGEKGQTSPAECFLMFSKEGFRQSLLHGHWTNLQALHPLRIASMLCSPEVNYVLRREIQKASGIKFSEEAICNIVLNQVLRGDLADQIKGNVYKK